jgi:peptidoglycan/LPS O-acetylase OafA/YrhL
MVNLAYGHVPLIAILPAYILAILLCATVFWKVIENPFTEWGKKLTDPRRSERTREATPAAA